VRRPKRRNKPLPPGRWRASNSDGGPRPGLIPVLSGAVGDGGQADDMTGADRATPGSLTGHGVPQRLLPMPSAQWLGSNAGCSPWPPALNPARCSLRQGVIGHFTIMCYIEVADADVSVS
jgi:hypothetical protein